MKIFAFSIPTLTPFSSETMISRNFKNILVVSIGFLSLFTAYGGLQSLQVSQADGAGSELVLFTF